jgi:hydroxyacylglutathione hydrolase
MFLGTRLEASPFLFDASRKVLFVGDTLRFDGSKVIGGPKQYTWAVNKEKASIEKISMLDFEIMLPGHGEVLKTNASKAVKEFVVSLK